MSESNKKRTNSFRKIFPSLFFSHKSKEKNSSKKNNSDNNSSKTNTYQNPRCITVKSGKYIPNTDDNDDRIYENLSLANRSQVDNDTQHIEMQSNHSSSSTLVSENIRSIINQKEIANLHVKNNIVYSARPQVPPKPNNKIMYSMPNRSNSGKSAQNPLYPDVYYHSMEKLSNKISPIDEMEIYRASQAQAHPTSVGAEIKKVSTKILISPKKEAEVRTIQPIRARSLSFERGKTHDTKLSNEVDKGTDRINKPYNYSAPTSPIAVSHKIPNMPTTVSPYELVRKTMMEAEERRNSLSRSSIHNKSTPSPSPQYMEPRVSTPIAKKQAISIDDSIEREKTRQKVEAFYWQKIKEQKQREDEYFLRQSLNSSLRSPVKYNTSYSNSNRSTPSSFALETKSCSLPRGKDLNLIINQPVYGAAPPFIRGAQERRTDSYIVNRIPNTVHDIVYRNPDKLIYRTSPLITRQSHSPIIQRGSLTQENKHVNQQTKRVSFEEHYSTNNTISTGDMLRADLVDLKSLGQYKHSRQNNDQNSCVKLSESVQGTLRGPPLPPVRTTSVGSAGKSYRIVDNKKIMLLTAGGYSVCSESESGSEASEIQKILQSNINKAYILVWDIKCNRKKHPNILIICIQYTNHDAVGTAPQSAHKGSTSFAHSRIKAVDSRLYEHP
ncbi:uncharacterized protein [Epargyreus clarus]|uniref:uncharacterized protein n=1 Tax=Epargyreus clarus TaxID=520877 RepID=UPI003C2BF00E